MGGDGTVFKVSGKITLAGLDEAFKGLYKLEGKSKEFFKALSIVGREVNTLGKKLHDSFTVPIAGAATALGALALKTGNHADKVLSMRAATGLSTDTLQEFAHVATAAGGSSEALFATITKLTGKLPDIATGTGKTAEAFHKLGLNVTNADGTYRSMDALFPEIITGLQGITDQTERNVLAYEIFGGASKEVSNFLGMSAGEMGNLRKEAHQLGLVMSGDSLKSADDFRVGVEKLKSQVSAIGMQIATGFMPILNEQLIPLIQTKVIPALQWLGEKAQWVAAAFSDLPTWVQDTTFVIGGLLAAAGPLLLLFGKAIVSIKGLLPLLAAGSKGIVAFTGVIKGLSVALLSNPIAMTVAAVAALTLAVWQGVKAWQAYKEAQRLTNETKEINETTDALYKNVQAAKLAKEEYEKLRGTAGFNADEYERLRTAHENAVISLKEYNNQLQKKGPLDEKEIEATRAKMREEKALQGVIGKTIDTKRKSEWQIAQEAKVAEEAAAKRAELAKRAAEEESRRKEELAGLVKANRDAIDTMILDEDRLLDKEEFADIEKARMLKANETELDAIRERYALIRNKRAQEANDEAIKLAEEELKTIGDLNKQWDDKLLQQSGNRLKILAAERSADIAAAAEAGADVGKIVEYYANEENRIKDEANKTYNEKLATQETERRRLMAASSNDAFAILGNEMDEKLNALRNEYARELAEAEKSGADISKIKEYYANEETNLAKEGANKRTEIRMNEMKQWASFGADAVNKIGSLLNASSANDEKRLDKEYKKRKEYIEANVDDETERAAQLKALEQEQDADKLEIQRENAKREKSLGVFNAIINTATAISKALTAGPIMGPIMAGIIGALGAAEISTIVSTPEPFAAGALIQGGRGGVTGLVGEGSQDELIMPMETGVDRLAAALNDKQVGGAVSNRNYTININAGTLVADDYSAKQFARKINAFIISDNLRKGET